VATPGGNAATSAQEEAQAERGWLGPRVVKLNERIAEQLETVRQVVTTIQGLAPGTVVTPTS